MPSSPNYVRDYAQEKRTSDARGEKAKRAARNRARYKAIKAGMIKPGDARDIDHKKPLSQGGAATSLSNLRPVSAHDNRSYARNADGSMKKGANK
jgi:hypothetical protein